MLITFEGIDRSGKSTQARMLFDRLGLEGYKSALVREPGDTRVGEKIRKIIQTDPLSPMAELFMFGAARAELMEYVHRVLNINNIVIMDRYIDSSVAYQGYGRKIDTKLINSINDIATNNTIPDITFLLNINVEDMRKRQSSNDVFESRSDAFYNRVIEGYMHQYQNNNRILLIDGTKPLDYIHKLIWQTTMHNLEIINGIH